MDVRSKVLKHKKDREAAAQFAMAAKEAQAARAQATRDAAARAEWEAETATLLKGLIAQMNDLARKVGDATRSHSRWM